MQESDPPHDPETPEKFETIRITLSPKPPVGQVPELSLPPRDEAVEGSQLDAPRDDDRQEAAREERGQEVQEFPLDPPKRKQEDENVAPKPTPEPAAASEKATVPTTQPGPEGLTNAARGAAAQVSAPDSGTIVSRLKTLGGVLLRSMVIGGIGAVGFLGARITDNSARDIDAARRDAEKLANDKGAELVVVKQELAATEAALKTAEAKGANAQLDKDAALVPKFEVVDFNAAAAKSQKDKEATDISVVSIRENLTNSAEKTDWKKRLETPPASISSGRSQ